MKIIFCIAKKIFKFCQVTGKEFVQIMVRETIQSAINVSKFFLH